MIKKIEDIRLAYKDEGGCISSERCQSKSEEISCSSGVIGRLRGIDEILKVAKNELDRIKEDKEFFYEDKLKSFEEFLVKGLSEFEGMIGMAESCVEAERFIPECKKLNRAMYLDSLTTMPNREYFQKKIINLTLAELPFYLMFIDLDDFKKINDRYGHNIGDEVLRTVSSRIKDVISKYGDYEVIEAFRLGGDEFTVLLKRNDEELIENIAIHLVEELKKPFYIADSKVHTTLSIGISHFPDDGKDSETIIKHADMAMYMAKRNGKNRYSFYDHSLGVSSQRRIALETKLHDAIENNEFELYFQPKFNIKEERFSGAEALLRWNSPDYNSVSPAEFIPIAEESRELICNIGKWVIKEACQIIKEIEENPKINDVEVSVNISVNQMNENNFVESLISIIGEYGINPSNLELEITEGVIMENPDVMKEKMSILKELGIKISIDDFGMGYSSMNRLKEMPVDKIKIDRSFMEKICLERKDRMVVEAMVAIAKGMDMVTVAEGVETEDQKACLKDLDIDEIQGFLYKKPLNIEEFKKFLNSD